MGSVAAALDGHLAAEEAFERGMRHGRDLVPHLSAICRRLGRPPLTIDVVAVSAGPGSYTGVRVGVTCAKILALATTWAHAPTPTAADDDEQAKPVVAVSTLEVLARNADAKAERVAVVVDARRGQLYAAFFRRVAGDLVRSSDDLVLRPEDLRARLAPGTCVVGDAVTRCPEVLAGLWVGGPAAAADDDEPAKPVAHARHVAAIGWREFLAGRTVPPHDLGPIYLRRPEAVDRLLSRQHRAGTGSAGSSSSAAAAGSPSSA